MELGGDEALRVDGVGPKMAQKILSSITPRELAAAIESENLARLGQPATLLTASISPAACGFEASRWMRIWVGLTALP